MKKIILIALSFNCVVSFSQETEFTFTKNGITDFVVTKIENKSQAELYKKTLDWIGINYKNPKEVLKGQVENEYIRIEGIEVNLFCLNPSLCQNMKYQIEISFKEAKYKIDIIALDQDMPELGWVHFNGLEDGSFYFNNKGEVKPKFKIFAEEIPKFFNKINKSISEYLVNGNLKNKKNDW